MLAFGDRFIALVFAIGVLVSGVLAALTTGAQAGPYEDALSRFSADSFDQTIEGINEVVASGNALAAPVITALQEGRFEAARGRLPTAAELAERLKVHPIPERLNFRMREAGQLEEH